MREDYWELEANASKRPSGWVSSMSNKGTSGANIEVLGTNIENEERMGMTACMNANEISGMMDVVTSVNESNA